MKSPVKKVAAIHDLSGIGRSALNSIIPILSSTGIQVCPFPTAILSSETAFYEDFTVPAKESLSYTSVGGDEFCVFWTYLSFLWLNSMPSGYNINVI